MILVFFLLLSLTTIYLSIKLSYYADILSKTTKLNNDTIGGVVLAGITSLPELITCYSSIYLNNVYLAIGDILGSNLFNICIICFFDIIFINKMLFNKTIFKPIINIILLINYFFIYLSFNGNVNISLLNIGLPSFIVFLTYIIYIKKIIKNTTTNKNIVKTDKYLIIKFILTALFLIIISTLLTIIVNKISLLNPSFSSSFIGAILLGITTSLPEVITFISLVKLNNYDMALSDILGSNLFNILVLAIGDIFYRQNQIYYYVDFSSILLLKFCVISTIINLYQNKKTKSINKITYIIPSLINIILYILFMIVNTI